MSLSDNWMTFIERLVNFFMKWVAEHTYWEKEDIETPHGFLTFFDAAGKYVLGAAFFLSIAWSKWRGYSCPHTDLLKTWLVCSWQAVLPCALVLIIGVVYYLSRRSAKDELYIAEKLFPHGNTPDYWIGRSDRPGIAISIVAFFALYLVLAWLSNNIRLVSFCMLAIAGIDLNTRRLINARANTYLTDPKYAPARDDKDYSVIYERRRVIHDYLYNKPHLRKEGARIGGCAIAFGLAMGGARSASYVVLLFTLIVNEIVTWKWRAERDRSLSPLLGRHRAVKEERPHDPSSASFSFIAWTASTLYMALAAWVAWKEGTLTSGSVMMGFLNHGGMWGDFIILPLVNGLIVPYFPRINAKRSIVACGLLGCAIIVTIFAHKQWAAFGKALGTTDFIFPSHHTGIWYLDMSVSGYLHIVYMTLELTFIFAYVVVSMSASRILWVSGLLTLHLILGQVQPGWYSTGTIWNARTIVPVLSTSVLTWLVGLHKIRQERRHATASNRV